MITAERHGTWHGIPSVTLANEDLEITYLPSRGGKIASLQSSGHEWLVQPQLPLHAAAPRYGDSFVEADVFGWDECAPTIDPCVLADGTQIPDHGEVWSSSWADVGPGSVKVTGVALDFELKRTIRLVANHLEIEYRLTGTGKGGPFLWSAHPLFRAPPGTEVHLGDEHSEVLDVTNDPPRAVRWDHGRSTIDSVAPGQYAKVYLPPAASSNCATLTLATGGSLRLSWDARQVPFLGVFMDNGRFCPEPAIALEPSTGWFDSLQRAQSNGLVAILPAEGNALVWSLRLTAEPPQRV